LLLGAATAKAAREARRKPFMLVIDETAAVFGWERCRRAQDNSSRDTAPSLSTLEKLCEA